MQHTPGPWTLNDGTLLQDSGRKLHIGTFNEAPGLGHAAAANARLICAAPAMLEALRDAHMGVGNWIPTNANGWLAKENLLQKIDRAIRAATGEV